MFFLDNATEQKSDIKFAIFTLIIFMLQLIIKRGASWLISVLHAESITFKNIKEIPEQAGRDKGNTTHTKMKKNVKLPLPSIVCTLKRMLVDLRAIP